MSSRTRVPRHLGARGYTVATVLIVIVVLAQLSMIVVVSSLGSREVDAAAADTFGYVGDLTVESVARYAESGRAMVDDTALFLTHATEVSHDDLIASLADRLSRTDNVHSLYVGWNDGSFLAVSREGEGFVSHWNAPDAGVQVVTEFDAALTQQSQVTEPSDYDPRTRPWFEAAQSARGGVWSDPYLNYESATTLVSPAAAVRVDGEVSAVVAADLDLPALRGILDDLPYGEGAEAFVLSQSLEIIGAPSRFTDQLEEIATERQAVPTAADLGLAVDPDPLGPGQTRMMREGSAMELDRALPERESVQWRVHLTAQAPQLSAGLGRIETALWWVSGMSLVVSGIAAVVAWNMTSSMGRMRRRASTDQLTGLANRYEYERSGRNVLMQAGIRGNRVLAVVLDLDGFKTVNDALGHDVGDAVLARTGEAIRTSVRSDDVAARLGGDEFLVLQQLMPHDNPHVIVERLRETVSRHLAELALEEVRVGVTLGYAMSRPGMDLKDLVSRADDALMRAKRSEKGTVRQG